MFYNKNLISTTELNDYITINFIPQKNGGKYKPFGLTDIMNLSPYSYNEYSIKRDKSNLSTYE